MPTELRERTLARVTEGVRDNGTVEVLIISPGVGSSGTYPAATLQQAGRDRVFAAGTHMYCDHPGQTEEADRPERSIRDLAGTLTTDAMWQDTPEPGLYATARIYPAWREVIAEMADDIGLSIRGFGEQDVDGNVTRLTQALSVDFVTRAGRGGRILQLVESARVPNLAEARNAGQWFESHLHLDFTRRADQLAADGHLTRDERIGLSAAIGDALTAFNGRVAADLPHLYQRDPYDEPSQPPAPIGEGPMPEITQEELDRLRATEAERDRLHTENETLTARNGTLTEANEGFRGRELAHAARQQASSLLSADGAPDLSEAARSRVADRVCAGTLPTTEAGALDSTVFAARLNEAAREEAEYLAEALGSTPPVAGAGNDPTSKAGDKPAAMSEADRAAAYASAFGLTESAAKAAATI